MTRRELFRKSLGLLIAGPLAKLIPEKYILGLKRSAPMTFPINWQIDGVPVEVGDTVLLKNVGDHWEGLATIGKPLTIKELTSMPTSQGKSPFTEKHIGNSTVLEFEGVRVAVLHGTEQQRERGVALLKDVYDPPVKVEEPPKRFGWGRQSDPVIPGE